MGIDLGTYRQRIGLYHAGRASRGCTKQLKENVKKALVLGVLFLMTPLAVSTALMLMSFPRLILGNEIVLTVPTPNLHCVSRHLQLCGDVEVNPGSPKGRNTSRVPDLTPRIVTSPIVEETVGHSKNLRGKQTC